METSRPYPIHDLHVQTLQSTPGDKHLRLTLLTREDHLLRRFGAAEAVHLEPEAPVAMVVREVADELWTLVEGRVEFIWHDLREDSPTFDRWHRLESAAPIRVLVPFGVAFATRAVDQPALLIRLMSHALDPAHADTVIEGSFEE